MKKKLLNLYNIFKRKFRPVLNTSYLIPRTSYFSPRAQRGGMMVELLLALALAAAMLPFLLRQETQRVMRAENVKAARDIALVKSALERYIDDNRRSLMSTISRNVVRVGIRDLEEYGLPLESVVSPEKFQLRVVKTADRGGRSFLQGIVVMDADDITPVRTREIAALSGDTAGFADGGRAYGVFGTWANNTNIWNARFSDTSILDMTQTFVSGDEYLMRVSSDNPDDAAMMADLSLGGHSVSGAKVVASETARFAEFVNGAGINAARLVMENRPTLDGNISVSGETTVAGALSSESRLMEAERVSVSGQSRFNLVTAGELWAGDLSLSGISISSDGVSPAVLSVNRAIDMVGGRVSAMLVTVGFTGSVTPRLVVRSLIEDASNPEYFWDVAGSRAVFSDLAVPVLNQMMQAAVKKEAASGQSLVAATDSMRIMSAVAANSNATVTDFMHALSEIEARVTAKYIQLNLE